MARSTRQSGYASPLPRGDTPLRAHARWRCGAWVGCAAVLFLTTCSAPPLAGPSEQLLTSAWRDFRLSEFISARRGFETVLSRLPADASGDAAEQRTFRLSALYGLGLLESLERPKSESGDPAKYFDTLIALDPGGDFAAWATLALIRDKHIPPRSDGRIDSAALRAAYEDVVTRFPKSPAAEEAFVYAESLHVQSLDAKDAEQSLAALDAYLAAHPKTRMRSAIHNLRATAATTLNRHPVALDALIKYVEFKEVDPASPIQASNATDYYRIGMMAQYDVGDFATARKYYGLLLEKYPGDQRAFSARYNLARLEATARSAAAGQWQPSPHVEVR